MEKNMLDEIRKEIDALDRELARLLQMRMDLVSRVAEYKKQTKTEVLDTAREQKVLDNALSVVTNEDYKESIKAVFENIMTHSKEYQKRSLLNSKESPIRLALIGEHLSHSLSPMIHKLFFEKTGKTGSYELIEVAPGDVPEIVHRLNSEGYSGLNVTIPYKTEVMRNLDKLSDEALRVGAVNTVKAGKSCTGYNTDYFGFGKALEHHGISIQNLSCAVLGSGGSSRAVVSYLEDHGASRIAIVTRDTDSTSLKYPGLQSIELSQFSARGFDLVVNTTPVGMSPNPGHSPLTREQLEGAAFVMDLIYNPRETLLMRYASEAGIPCANGLYMLVAQAVCAQEIWQGMSFDQTLIKSIYEDLKGL